MSTSRYAPVRHQQGSDDEVEQRLDALVQHAAQRGGDLERLKSAKARILKAGEASSQQPPTAPMDESVEMRELIAPEPSSVIAGSHEQWFPEQPVDVDSPTNPRQHGLSRATSRRTTRRTTRLEGTWRARARGYVSFKCTGGGW